MEVDPTDREKENWEALGGMRNPHIAAAKIPGMFERGAAVRAFIDKAIKLWPQLTVPARSILQGDTPHELPQELVCKLRQILLDRLWAAAPRPQRTARAKTPLQAAVIAGWKEDPDSKTLATWLDKGAPMGFAEEVTPTGVFPRVPAKQVEVEYEQIQAKTLHGWTNYDSAEQEKEELLNLVKGYIERGFCHTVESLDVAEEELGRKPILNKLGVIVKMKEMDDNSKVKKARIIWDLRRSGANSVCQQSERVLLPRLLDVAAHAIDEYKKGNPLWIAAVDIRDAFMNVPVEGDRFALTAALPPSGPDKQSAILIFDTLVFGAASAPTVWGRYAAFLGRTIAAVSPEVGCQIYVDDPIFTLAGDLDQASHGLAVVLVWMAILGYPVKLSKASGGKALTWIGAHLQLDDEKGEVIVTIPNDKVQKLLKETDSFLRKPVVGCRELRAYAGALSFVAGLVPHLRPFLSSIWAVLPTNRVATGDGAHAKGISGKLVHVRRIRPALCWIKSLLDGSGAKLQRTLSAFHPEREVTVTTDACPFGIGGTLRVSGELVSSFASDLPKSILDKFKANRGDAKHTTLWEAIALLFACRTWLPAFKGIAKVRCKSDSLSLLYMLMKGKAKSADLTVIAREFAIDLARDKYRLHLLKHIPGVTNIEADALSRVCAPVVPEIPLSLAGVPRIEVDFSPDFWQVLI